MQHDFADSRQIGTGWRLLVVDQSSGKVRRALLYSRSAAVLRQDLVRVAQAVLPQVRHSQLSCGALWRNFRRWQGRLPPVGNVQHDFADGREIGAGWRLLVIDQSSRKFRRALFYSRLAAVLRQDLVRVAQAVLPQVRHPQLPRGPLSLKLSRSDRVLAGRQPFLVFGNSDGQQSVQGCREQQGRGDYCNGAPTSPISRLDANRCGRHGAAPTMPVRVPVNLRHLCGELRMSLVPEPGRRWGEIPRAGLTWLRLISHRILPVSPAKKQETFRTS